MSSKVNVPIACAVGEFTVKWERIYERGSMRNMDREQSKKARLQEV